MKLVEAAHVLGISLEDVTIDILNKTYKKLILSLEPEKTLPQSKQRYVQIHEAYRKLSLVMEGKDSFRADEQHDIAAFMKIFMDMVGVTDSDSLPSPAMTFEMMFGSQNGTGEEWSTDDDGEGEYEEEDDDDEDDDDEDIDEEDEDDEDDDEDDGHVDDGFSQEDEDFPPLASTSAGGAAEWEPAAKQYSNMNLKDQVSRERMQELSKTDEEKKQKVAKKRADKRKKQKEKKLRDTLLKEMGSVDEDIVVAQSKRSPHQQEPYTAEELAELTKQCKAHLKEELIVAVQNGRLEIVDHLVSFKFPPDLPFEVMEEVMEQLRSEIASYHLLHKCITDYNAQQSSTNIATGGKSNGGNHKKDVTKSANVMAVAVENEHLQNQRKVLVFERLLALSDPILELHGCDESGLSVLHRAVQCGDLEITKVAIRVIEESLAEPAVEKRRTTLNLNTRCHKKGWAAIHYATEKYNVDMIRLLAQHGANLQATSAMDKRLTPLELAKSKLKLAGSNTQLKVKIQACIDEISRLLAAQKAVARDAQVATANDSKVHLENSTAAPVPESKSCKSEPAVSTAAEVNSADAATAPVAKGSEKKKKKSAVEAKNDTNVAPTLPAATVTPSKAPAPKAKSNAKSSKAPLTPAVAPVISISSQVVSRDEMVDRLLAMGFRESECLAAIGLYGTDIDQAISWLIERPEGTSTQTAPLSTIASDSVTDTSKSTAVASAEAGQSKEELRRINRAWNAKAEDEKRKLEQQRKLAEETKQKESTSTSAPQAVPPSAPPVVAPSTSTVTGPAKSSQKHEREKGTTPSKSQREKSNGEKSAGHLERGKSSANANSGIASSSAKATDAPPLDLGLGSAVFPSMQSSMLHGTTDFFGAHGSTAAVFSLQEPSDESIVYSTGAIELSAGAKPFVPRSFTPTAVPSTPTPLTPSIAVSSNSGVGTSLSSSVLENGLTSSSGFVSSLNLHPPVTSVPLTSGIGFSSALLGAVGVDSTTGLSGSGLLGGLGSSANSLLGGLGASTSTLSALDGGLGISTSALWGPAGSSGLSLSSSGLDDPFANLESAMNSTSTTSFLSGILGTSDLQLTTDDQFDFGSPNSGFVPNLLDSLLSPDSMKEFK